MGFQIGKRDTFLGFPAIAARDTLKDWVNQTGTDAFGLTPHGRTPRDAPSRIAILQEMADKGWFDGEPGDWIYQRLGRLTPEAQSFVRAGTAKRTPKAKAWALLNALVARCAALNADPRRAYHVGQVWAFGSLIDDAKTDVGDVDFAIELVRTPWFEGLDPAERRKVEWRDAVETNSQGLAAIGASRRLATRAALGPRKNPLLSQAEIHDLKGLGCPCRLVFDAAAGPTPDAANLPRHPDSPGRDADRPPQAAAVDLSHASILTPADAAHASTVQQSWKRHGELTGENLGLRRAELFDDLIAGRWMPQATTDGDAISAVIGPAAAWLAARGVADSESGMTVTAIAELRDDHGRRNDLEARAAATLRRAVRPGESEAALSCWMAPDGRDAAMAVVAAALTLATADAIRACAHNGGSAEVEIAFEVDGSPGSSGHATAMSEIARDLLGAGMIEHVCPGARVTLVLRRG